MEYFFAKSKIFRLHAILHDSAGSVKSTAKKGAGFCYVASSLPSCWSRDWNDFLFIC